MFFVVHTLPQQTCVFVYIFQIDSRSPSHTVIQAKVRGVVGESN